MKIGFDGKRAIQNMTGLGNYSRYIVKILCHYYEEHEYILYAPRKKEGVANKLLNRYSHLKAAYPDSGWKYLSSLWRIWGISAQLHEDEISVFHGLSNELPLNIGRTRVKRVVTIHDLIFLRFPQYYKPADRIIYTYKFRKACRNADLIIAVSECTKRDIMHFFQIPEKKIEVVYQGCDEAFFHPASENKKEEVRRRYQLPEKYLLNVGTIEERKNALLILKALPGLPTDVHLVIVGRRTPYTQEIEKFAAENNLSHRLHILSKVPHADLPAIYQSADVFVYPSRYEGFGIPVLEALHSRIPVIAATGSCLEEAGGAGSIYVHPDDAGGLAKALTAVLSTKELRERMIAAGQEYAIRFSEERQAKKLMEVYEGV